MTLAEWLKTERALEDNVRLARSSDDRREAEDALKEWRLATPKPAK